MKPTRRSLVLGALAAPFAGKARADNWPSGIIKIIVPFPPGGSVDPIARMAQPGLQQKLNANIVIENRPGSSGSLGTSLVAKSPPDGNTWVFVFDSHAVNPFLMDQNFRFWVPGRHRESSQETQPLVQIPYNLLGWIDPRSCKTLDANSSRQVTSIFYTLEPARLISVSWPRPLIC